MNNLTISELKAKVTMHLNLSGLFDLPVGRHDEIIEEYYLNSGNTQSDNIAAKLSYILKNLHSFNDFIETKETFKSSRLNDERQAKVEPERTEAAINKLSEMGFEVTVINSNEINFKYKGENIKYFPYSGWASGKTIKDGRGLKNLLSQLI